MVVFGQKWFFSGKSGSVREKDVVLGQNCCVRTRVVLVGQKWLYSGKSGCIRAKVVVIGEVVLIRHKWLYLGKVVVI